MRVDFAFMVWHKVVDCRFASIFFFFCPFLIRRCGIRAWWYFEDLEWLRKTHQKVSLTVLKEDEPGTIVSLKTCAEEECQIE